MVDLISYIDKMPKDGETLEAANFSMGCGGKGANQAVAAAKCGADIMMMTMVGDDIFADNTIGNFKKYGIDTTFVKKVTGKSSGVAPIFVDKSGQNRILIVKGANGDLLPKDIDAAAEKLKECSLIILQLEINLETVYYAIEFANKNNIQVLLNPAPANKNLDIDKISTCDFFVPNETELEIITNMPIKNVEDVKKAALTLIEKGIRNVIVTMGEKGSMLVTKDKIHLVESFKVDAIDTSGAGDAFIGCFASCYVKNKNVVSAMIEASAFSALSVTKKGTQISYPEKKEVSNLINNNK